MKRKIADRVSDETLYTMGLLTGDKGAWEEHLRRCGWVKQADGKWARKLVAGMRFVPDNQGGHILYQGKVWRPVADEAGASGAQPEG